jgi:predicted pyridoxine 5'-phosphate oxidase superfamily flavin-nucleotide-binding protein
VHSKIIWRPVPAVSASVNQRGRVQIIDPKADAVIDVQIEIRPGTRRLNVESNGRVIAFGRSMAACKSQVEQIVRHTPERLITGIHR